MNTMKAVRLYSYGGPNVLVYEDAPMPSPGAGAVRVRVHAAGVNPVDWKIREGYYREKMHHTLPLIPGWDVSGVVEALGLGVTRFREGDLVFGRPDILANGAYAQYIVVKETELAAKPKTLDHPHAAAIPLASLTAWQSLFGAGRLSAGQRVLIHAAAGGVGHYAVQLAKWKGAEVIGTASARNRDFVRGLGADEVVDYEAGPFEETVRNVDLVLDTMGGETQARSWKVLKRGGLLVSIVSPPPAELAVAHDVRGAYVFVQPNAVQLAEIAELTDRGLLRPALDVVFQLSEARQAQERSQGGHVRGKIVLEVPGG
jgi:NADPH:quinone reductase-like Zn-dependent oxidoreductase